MLLSTEPYSQLIPVNLVTRPSLSLRLGSNNHPEPNELPDNDDTVVIEAEVTELISVTTTSTTSGKIQRSYIFNLKRDFLITKRKIRKITLAYLKHS